MHTLCLSFSGHGLMEKVNHICDGFFERAFLYLCRNYCKPARKKKENKTLPFTDVWIHKIKLIVVQRRTTTICSVFCIGPFGFINIAAVV